MRGPDSGPALDLLAALRRSAGFLGDSGNVEGLAEPKSRPDNGAHGDHLRGELGFVVGEPVAEQEPVLLVRAAQPPLLLRPGGGCRALRVHVGVEDQRPGAARPIARAAQDPDGVGAGRVDPLQPGLDPRLVEPGFDRLGDRDFVSGVIARIAEAEAKLDQRPPLPVDDFDDSIRERRRFQLSIPHESIASSNILNPPAHDRQRRFTQVRTPE